MHFWFNGFEEGFNENFKEKFLDLMRFEINLKVSACCSWDGRGSFSRYETFNTLVKFKLFQE